MQQIILAFGAVVAGQPLGYIAPEVSSMKNSLVSNVSETLWLEAVGKFQERLIQLKKLLHSNTDHDFGEGVEMAPCTTELWRKYVGVEHDEYTAYFKHWFRKIDGKAVMTPFSHLALMPLVRSSIYQTILAEFITGKLAGRDAVRLRVEYELEHYSNLHSTELRSKVGMLAEDFFGLVKNHLNAKDRPVNRTGLSGAERLVVNLPGLDYRGKRKGWSNRKLRQILARQIINHGFEQIPTRGEQEAFVWKWLSVDDCLKQSACKAILKLLAGITDETGVCVLKPWSKEELSQIRREAREKGSIPKTMQKVNVISEKLKNGEKLTESERKFHYRHGDLFEVAKTDPSEKSWDKSKDNS